MRSMRVVVICALITAMAAVSLAYAVQERTMVQNRERTRATVRPSPSVVPLSEEEKTNLIFMREEEKLARDVYLKMYEIYKDGIFLIIAGSEEKHATQVARLLAKYKVPDPVVDNTPGVFVNPDLQTLYGTLVAAGSASLAEALRVGALIEETDIRDLQAAISASTHADIVRVYSNLLAASKNHLRAFVKRIEALGTASYVAQVLSQDEVDAIVN